MMPASLARKMLDLCRKHSRLVSESVRENALTAGLVDMVEASKANYLMLLINESVTIMGER